MIYQILPGFSLIHCPITLPTCSNHRLACPPFIWFEPCICMFISKSLGCLHMCILCRAQKKRTRHVVTKKPWWWKKWLSDQSSTTSSIGYPSWSRGVGQSWIHAVNPTLSLDMCEELLYEELPKIWADSTCGFILAWLTPSFCIIPTLWTSPQTITIPKSEIERCLGQKLVVDQQSPALSDTLLNF